MQKGDSGDGVSHTGDGGMDHDALAAAMEDHFAPFAAGRRSVAVPVPHDAPRADAELDESAEGGDADPEVTAITRRFDRTGDTLGAMDELEQLLIERTGQIPVVTPELLAAHAARIERADLEKARPEPVVADEAEAEASDIDWAITPPAALDPAPGFSPWIDPEATAAAVDTARAPEFTDVSTSVFALFSADEPVVPEPVADEPEPARDDELDDIDDLAVAPEAPAAPTDAPGPEPAPERAAAPEAAADPAPPAEDPKPKRRFWPFGRR